ncbi:MAG TPA: hypothetical protein VHB98_00935 [Chloroflexota bacterium]|nr:hypothetical protein [Chloroflexota bacterium]
MNKQSVKWTALGLTLLGITAVVGVGIAPAAHAQSSAPTLSAGITSLGYYDRFTVSGAGFTPGSIQTIEVVNTATGAVLDTVSVQATPSTTAATSLHNLDSTASTAARTSSNSGGAISTSFSLAIPTSVTQVTVEASDAATSLTSNPVTLSVADPPSSQPTVSASLTATGSGTQVSVSGSGFTAGSPVNIEAINTATGAVLQTIATQATSSTDTVTNVSELVCTFASNAGSPLIVSTQPGTLLGYLGLANQQNCTYQMVTVPETSSTHGGTISTSFPLALPTSVTEVTIEAVDTASASASNTVTMATN